MAARGPPPPEDAPGGRLDGGSAGAAPGDATPNPAADGKTSASKRGSTDHGLLEGCPAATSAGGGRPDAGDGRETGPETPGPSEVGATTPPP
ncbi:MAG: hypothetical protein AAGA56_06630, partial [Myxococcota bacterium]